MKQAGGETKAQLQSRSFVARIKAGERVRFASWILLRFIQATFNRLLSDLATITQGIAELRNHYGTGRGKAAGAKGLCSQPAKFGVRIL